MRKPAWSSYCGKVWVTAGDPERELHVCSLKENHKGACKCGDCERGARHIREGEVR